MPHRHVLHVFRWWTDEKKVGAFKWMGKNEQIIDHHYFVVGFDF